MASDTVLDLDQATLDALWIRDVWITELIARIEVMDAVLGEWGIEHPVRIKPGEVLPGSVR